MIILIFQPLVFTRHLGHLQFLKSLRIRGGIYASAVKNNKTNKHRKKKFKERNQNKSTLKINLKKKILSLLFHFDYYTSLHFRCHEPHLARFSRAARGKLRCCTAAKVDNSARLNRTIHVQHTYREVFHRGASDLHSRAREHISSAYTHSLSPFFYFGASRVCGSSLLTRERGECGVGCTRACRSSCLEVNRVFGFFFFFCLILIMMMVMYKLRLF